MVSRSRGDIHHGGNHRRVVDYTPTDRWQASNGGQDSHTQGNPRAPAPWGRLIFQIIRPIDMGGFKIALDPIPPRFLIHAGSHGRNRFFM
jgi:hypothetical protein